VSPKATRPAPPKSPDPNALKRESAGRYRTADERFEVEQNSGRWMISDTAETNDFGLPLIRGPFATLDEVREAIREAREGGPPTSPLATRVRERGTTAPPRKRPTGDEEDTKADRPRIVEPEPEPEREPEPAPIEIRRLEPGDDGLVRKLAALSELAAAACGPLGAPDERDPGPVDRESARRLLARSDVHVVVAVEDGEPIGHALAFEPPRLRDETPMVVIDEIAVAEDRRRRGVGSRLANALFELADELGVRRAIGFAGPDDKAAQAFYRSVGGRPRRSEPGTIDLELGTGSKRGR
jgi:GNAT superfamily N-acetyltransferase